MKKILLLLILSGLCLAANNVQIYKLGNNHVAALYHNTLTNVPERVVKAEVKTVDGSIYKVFVLREIPPTIKEVNVKNKKLSVVTNENGFIYYKLTELTDNEKKIYH